MAADDQPSKHLSWGKVVQPPSSISYIALYSEGYDKRYAFIVTSLQN